MTSSVPSLTELAARVVNENHDIAQLQPQLPAELIDYLATLSGELPLHLATVFYDKYAEVTHAFGAVGGQDADLAGVDHFLAEYQQVLLLHDQAADVLQTALAAAFNVTDQHWREYMTTLLSEVGEHMSTLASRAENAVEYLTWLRTAF